MKPSYPYCPEYPELNPRVRFRSAPGWMDFNSGLCCNNMEDHWRAIQPPGFTRPVDLRGANFFVFPAPREGTSYSARFDANSPFFQAFFGVYALPPHEGTRLPLDMQLLAELGRRDNQAWLRFMGDPNYAQTSALVESDHTLEASAADGSQRKIGTVRFDWHVDVGPGNPRPGGAAPDLWAPPASAWRDHVSAYQPAVQRPARFVAWHAGDYLIANFIIAAEFRRRDGAMIRTIEDGAFAAGLEAMAASVTVEDDGGGYRPPRRRGARPVD